MIKRHAFFGGLFMSPVHVEKGCRFGYWFYDHIGNKLTLIASRM